MMPAMGSFHTTTKREGIVSSIGTAGMLGIMVSPVVPKGEAFLNTYLAKDEYKVLAWMGGMAVFGAMASVGGGKAEPVVEVVDPAAEAEIAAFLEAFADPADKNDLEVVHTKSAPGAIGPYSQAIKSGGFMYTSGQIAMEARTGKIPTQMQKDAGAQTVKCLKNLDNILTAGGVTKKDVTKVTVFVQDLKDFNTVNKAYVSYFGKHKPARSCVQVAGLPKGALVEIEAVAKIKAVEVSK